MLLEEIYQGKIIPQENIKPERKEYKLLSKKRSDLYKELSELMDKNKIKKLDEYTNIMFGICEEQSMSAFAYGVRFGMNLNNEIKSYNSF